MRGERRAFERRDFFFVQKKALLTLTSKKVSRK